MVQYNTLIVASWNLLKIPTETYSNSPFAACAQSVQVVVI